MQFYHPFSGVKTVGVNGDFKSFTANDSTGVFYSLKNATLNNDLTLKVISNITETGTQSLNAIYREGANWAIKVIPDSAVERKITGAYPSDAPIKIENISNFTIDGSINGFGKYLTFANNASSASTSAAIRLSGTGTAGTGCRNVAIKNSNIVGANITSTTSFALYIGSKSFPSTGDGSDSILIDNNYIYRAYEAVRIDGDTGMKNNTNLIIKNNTIGGIPDSNYTTLYGINVSGATNGVISNNEIRNVYSTTVYKQAGIIVNTNCDNLSLNKNIIHNIKFWTTSSNGQGAYGVQIKGSNRRINR